MGAEFALYSVNADEDGGRISWSKSAYDQTLASSTAVMRDGSASGDILFSFALPVGATNWSCGQAPFAFMFGNGYIEFNSGIYVEAWDHAGSVARPLQSETNLYIYYEGA